MVAPIIEELAAEYEGRVVIGKCDVDEEGDVAAEFGIRNIPAVFFFKNGELVDKQIGAAPKAKYVEKIEALLWMTNLWTKTSMTKKPSSLSRTIFHKI